MIKNKSEITKTILQIFLNLGIVAISFVVPNIASSIAKLSNSSEMFSIRQIYRSFGQLSKKKLIKVRNDNGKIYIEVTRQGQVRLREMLLNELKIKKPKKWDRKWRMVMFDIPENLRTKRTELVSHLKHLGMIMFQKSVWIYPYPCDQEINTISEFYKIFKFVKVIIVDELEVDHRIIEYYKLEN